MKKINMILLLIFLFSCKKNDLSSNSSQPSVVGNWKLQYQIGGITGTQRINPTTTVILALNADQSFQTTNSGQVQDQGTYTLGKVQSIFTGTSDDGINFSSSNTWKIITVKNDTLAISDNHVEPTASIYWKVK